MLKNKIITVLLMLTLISPVIAEPEGMGNSTIPYKQPVSKRKVAKKFLAAMAGVGVSSNSSICNFKLIQQSPLKHY